jgi:hypothetical protein
VRPLAFLEASLGLTTTEVAAVFRTSERRVLAWWTRYLLPSGQHCQVCRELEDLSLYATTLAGRLLRARGMSHAMTLAQWVRLPNGDLGGATPLNVLMAGRRSDVRRAMNAEAAREPRVALQHLTPDTRRGSIW